MNLVNRKYNKNKKKESHLINSLNRILVSSDDIAIIDSPQAFHKKLIELIKQAKKRIYFTTLYLQDDTAGAEILNCLYQAKQNNPDLDIKIFVDFLRAQRGLMGQPESIGNIRLYRECAEKYEYPIDILGVPVKTKEVLGVLHLKGFIFDDTLLYSGASINDIYLQQANRYRLDRYHLIHNQALCDSMVNFLKNYLFSSPAVKSLTTEKKFHKKQLKLAVKKFKRSLKLGNYQFGNDLTLLKENQVSVTPLIGFGGRNNLLNKVIYELIKTTQTEVSIYTPYFNLPRKINHAIRRLLRKGGKVNLVVGDKKANDFYIPTDQPFNKIGIVPYVYENNLRKFVKRHQDFVDSGLLNIFLWSHKENSFHLKGIAKDNVDYLITGHNINPRAWRLDLENGILIRDSSQLLRKDFESEFNRILEHTQKITHFMQIETIEDYPEAPRKLMVSVKRAKLDSILNRIL